ncbi:MAG: hypothetical protein LBE12_07610 [Planctomycetaceae bacterium]|jgi:hypothetical protein|nr:hypothetical protein [Planctomycetaceae bacterium]
MPTLKHEITIENSCSLIRKSKDVFAPIKEAITNSFDAITQRQKIENKKFQPAITLSLYFKNNNNELIKDMTYTLDFVSVEDNGIGFTKENINRFKKLAENTKGLNNKGTGKIQIFHQFNKITINSFFIENNKLNQLEFFCKKNGNYKETLTVTELTETENSNKIKTIVKLEEFNGNKKESEFFVKYLQNIDDFKRDVLKHFLLRLRLGTSNDNLTFTIKVFLNNKEQNEFIFNQKNIVEPDKKLKIEINAEQYNNINNIAKWTAIEPKHEISIQRFKLSDKELAENGIYLCSKNIVVSPFKFPAIKKNTIFEGFRYFTCISGDIFDDPQNLSQSADDFTFPSKEKVEETLKNTLPLFQEDPAYVFWEEIENKINKGLVEIFSDVGNLHEKRYKDIIKQAKKYGISPEIAELANIALNDTDDEVTKKLFAAQAKKLANQSIEIQKSYEELKSEIAHLNPADPDYSKYRKNLNEIVNKLLSLIPQQNKEELARYIIRREMVVELLKQILKNKLDIQKDWEKQKQNNEKITRDKEGIIHDLIFKRRNKGIPNDLWILNEEFVHFDGCSDLRLEEIEVNGKKLLKDKTNIDKALQDVGITKNSYVKKRPDIFLFPEEGKCILIEFKAPDVDLVLHCDQIQRYARLIANFSRIKFNQFFGFLIGENIDVVSLPGRYRKIPCGNSRVCPNEPINSIDESEAVIANLYQEIIPLSEIAQRAEIRNKSFAEKLGITEDNKDILITL